ncbi:TetR/AcrR family transcriptional regulator [Mycobacterium vicinigordonae]|uniref:TetR/AcrR family transcriptional regulator n=1 Tax=Mycobacterium vicinigordonae TaxID=1719132 RepID=A0A7D6E2Q3_9MYCO|nr:TetR/AcrR family transcriptional regulator [Mycobacterium vicinigordonae]QLL09849.1 TetR/AcrR family transcriptional regulator [Mycobacterium vicinigordonae]
MISDSLDAAHNPAESIEPQRKSLPGRRRDPAIDDKIRQAARTLYAREGWAGFHFDGVARAAGVSKDAVYRRYPDAQALLLDALSELTFPVLQEGKPIEEALVGYACGVFSYFAGGDGYANLRVHVDAVQYPEVLQKYRDRVVEPQLARAVAVLERARAQGQLHPDTSCAAVIEALGGAVMIYALACAPWPGAVDDEEAGVIDTATERQLTGFVQQILYGHLRLDDRVKSSTGPRRRRATATR